MLIIAVSTLLFAAGLLGAIRHNGLHAHLEYWTSVARDRLALLAGSAVAIVAMASGVVAGAWLALLTGPLIGAIVAAVVADLRRWRARRTRGPNPSG